MREIAHPTSSNPAPDGRPAPCHDPSWNGRQHAVSAHSGVERDERGSVHMRAHDHGPGQRSTSALVRTGPRRARLAAWMLVTAALAASWLLCEVVLRLAFPPHRFLDPHTNCFWSTRLRHAMDRQGDENELFGRGQYDAQLGWKPQPSLRSALQNTNARGLRGRREYPYAKPEGTFRLLAHGDSFTWGLGVGDDEIYSSRLAAAIPGSEVLNMGINGHGIDQQYLYWRAEGSRYQPDLVLLGFYVADFHRSALQIREFPKPSFTLDRGTLQLVGSPVPTPTQYLANPETECRSMSRVLDLAVAVRRRLRPHESEATFRNKAALTQAILAAWSAELQRSNTSFCVVVIPHARSRDYPDHERIERLIEASASAGGFDVLNLTAALRRFEAQGATAYQASNGHWSAEGHAFAAQQIAAFLDSTRAFELTHGVRADGKVDVAPRARRRRDADETRVRAADQSSTMEALFR